MAMEHKPSPVNMIIRMRELFVFSKKLIPIHQYSRNIDKLEATHFVMKFY